MNNTIEIQVRVFPVLIKDERTDGVDEDSIVLTKEQLQAAGVVGQSSKELIYRLYNRRGYKVLAIGKPIKKTITVDMYAAGIHTNDCGRLVTEGAKLVAEGEALLGQGGGL